MPGELLELLERAGELEPREEPGALELLDAGGRAPRAGPPIDDGARAMERSTARR